jgi:hypothetical protein
MVIGAVDPYHGLDRLFFPFDPRTLLCRLTFGEWLCFQLAYLLID